MDVVESQVILITFENTSPSYKIHCLAKVSIRGFIRSFLIFFWRRLNYMLLVLFFWPYYLDVMNRLTEYCWVLQHIAQRCYRIFSPGQYAVIDPALSIGLDCTVSRGPFQLQLFWFCEILWFLDCNYIKCILPPWIKWKLWGIQEWKEEKLMWRAFSLLSWSTWLFFGDVS